MVDDALVTIEVDGRVLKARPGTLLIDVTDAAGIPIPRFCYHKKLSVAANCRMCLVEVEKVPKPLPACATPVNEGMRVYTRSPRALAAQKGTMEFLLINHPLDCPICDQGGECELQDVAMGYGGDMSRFAERKRVVKDENLGPLVATDMTRCIHCTRCVRFGAEIAGVRELGATGRGEHMRIGTFVGHTVDHELSGNIIDLCPVGALTSKPFRFKARAWELSQRDGIAPHDAVGSNLHFHIRDNRVMRVHPKDNEAVNETWISDRDRFSYEGLYADDRLLRPRVKKDGVWHEAGWEAALELAASRLKGIAKGDADQLAALLAPNATLEEMYLAQKLVRGLGSRHIDCRLRQMDFRGDPSDPLFPWLGVGIAALEEQAAVLVVGSNIRKEQPLLAHRLRKAAQQGGAVTFVNPFALDLTFDANQLVASPQGILGHLAAIAKALGEGGSGRLKDLVSVATPTDVHQKIAQQLGTGEATVLLGGLAAAHPDYAAIKALAYAVAKGSGARVGYLPPSANSVGAHLAGALPHVRAGANPAEPAGETAAALLTQSRKAYLLWGIEPDFDVANPAAARAALDGAEFVVACSAFRSPSLEALADVMLPVAAYAETAGTLVNAAGTWQSFQGVVAPPGEARPGWKVLRVLGSLLDLKGFDFIDAGEVLAELKSLCGEAHPDNTPRGAYDVQLQGGADGLVRIGDVPIYATDPLVRRAGSLQQTRDAIRLCALLNPAEAQRLGLAGGERVRVRQNGVAVEMDVAIDPAVASDCVRVPSAVPGSEGLGPLMGAVTLEKV